MKLWEISQKIIVTIQITKKYVYSLFYFPVRILTYDIVFTEQKFEKVEFIPFNITLNLENDYKVLLLYY